MREPDMRLLRMLREHVGDDCHHLVELGAGDCVYISSIAAKKKTAVDIHWPAMRNAPKDVNCIKRDMGKFSIPWDASCVMLLDSLEHVDRDVGLRILKRAEFAKTIVFCPHGENNQGPAEDNPHQEHRSTWTKNDLSGLGFAVHVLEGFHHSLDIPNKDAMFAVRQPGAVPAMIPKRALFYWDSGELPPERKLAIDTFVKLNPEWEVEVYNDPGINAETAVHRSDWFRYNELYENGGVYFDTDIIFTKPFPDDLLRASVLLPLHEKRKFHNVAVLGGAKAACFWYDVLLASSIKLVHPKYREHHRDYQYLGVPMLNRMFHEETGLSTHPMCPTNVLRGLSKAFPEDKILNVGWDFVCPFEEWDCPELYSRGPVPKMPESSIGLHWYGGHKESGKFVDDVRSGAFSTRVGRLAKEVLG